MVSQKRYPTINGNTYYVKIVETDKNKRVTVYNNDKYTSFYKGGSNENYIVSNTVKRGRFLWFGKDKSPPIEEMIQETLNEAVCIREDKEDNKERFEDKISEAICNVEEAYEE